MRVLIGCESSGVVREAFRALGHEAWSCDLLPSEILGQHYQADILEVIGYGWDLLIAHPPCTYLSVSGMHWTVRGLRDPKLTDRAIEFAERLWASPVERIALENPVGVLSTRSKLGKCTQSIQPFNFGHDASKRTCLWLKNIPPLRHGVFVPPRIVEGKKRWANQTDSGQNKLPPSRDRWKERSRTYAGIAEAMALQWGDPDAFRKHIAPLEWFSRAA